MEKFFPLLKRGNISKISQDSDWPVLMRRTAVVPSFSNHFKSRLVESDVVNMHKIKDILVHVTDKCNLTCPMCYRQDYVKQEDMTLEKFREVVKKHKSCKISLIGMEPSLHPKAVDMIKIIKDEGCTASIITNGLKFSNFKFTKRMKDAGLDHLYFSMDGFSYEINQKLRGGGEIAYSLKLKALSNIKKLGIQTTLLATVVKNFNENQISVLFDFAKKNDFIKVLSLRPLHKVDSWDLDISSLSPNEMWSVVESQTNGLVSKRYTKLWNLFFRELNSVTKNFMLNRTSPYDYWNLSYYNRNKNGFERLIGEEELLELVYRLRNNEFHKLFKLKYLKMGLPVFKNKFNFFEAEKEMFEKGLFKVFIGRVMSATAIQPNVLNTLSYDSKGEIIKTVLL